MDAYQKSGYLKEDFRYFHLCTNKMQEFHYHYHDFHKVLFFLKGDVTYHIEGKEFALLPKDIVLIPAGDIHRPVLKSNSPYERIILYLAPDFLDSLGTEEEHLGFCFQSQKTRQLNVIRIPPSYQNIFSHTCSCLEKELKEDSLFAGEFYRRSLAGQLMVILNRAALNQESIYPENTCKDEIVLNILEYINGNLGEALSIDSISAQFFISRYHLMHLFKASTGYTVGNYITLKRLLWARSMIQSGMGVTAACYRSGFQNYSAFSRAYKKQFHVSAKNG